jgi:hypothetical protein
MPVGPGPRDPTTRGLGGVRTRQEENRPCRPGGIHPSDARREGEVCHPVCPPVAAHAGRPRGDPMEGK